MMTCGPSKFELSMEASGLGFMGLINGPTTTNRIKLTNTCSDFKD